MPEDLKPLLAARGVLEPAVERLRGGEKNENYLVTAVGRRFVAKVYSLSTGEEVEYELQAAELAATMHTLTDGRTFDGRRNPERDPLRRIRAFRSWSGAQRHQPTEPAHRPGFGNLLRAGASVRDARESHSMALFLDLAENGCQPQG